MESQRHKQSRLTWIFPLALLLVLILLYWVWPGFQTFVNEAYQVLTSGDEQRVQAWVQQYDAWGPLVILALMLFQTLAAFVPSVIIMVVAVLSYGSLWGGLLAWGGLMLAACLAYGIGRALGPVVVSRLIGERAEVKMEHYVRRYGLWAVIAARISPVISTDAVSFVAGFGCMRFWQFIIATGVGLLPLTLLIAWLGRDMDRMTWGLTAISIVSLIAVACYIWYDHRRNQEEAEPPSPEEAERESPGQCAEK